MTSHDDLVWVQMPRWVRDEYVRIPIPANAGKMRQVLTDCCARAQQGERAGATQDPKPTGLPLQARMVASGFRELINRGLMRVDLAENPESSGYSISLTPALKEMLEQQPCVGGNTK